MAGEGASPGPASAVMGFVGSVVEKVTAPIDALNLAVGKATYAFVLMLPSFPAARLWSDLVFQFGHSHPHPPTFGFPLPSFGPILASGSQSVLINGLPAARCGDLGLSVWCGGYIPIFEVLTGSSHVFIGGARASRMLFDLTFHCLPDPFAGLGKVAKVQKFLTVGEVLGAGIGAGMSLLGAAAAQEEAGAAQNEASDAAAQAEALALAAAESSAIEAQMQAMMAGLSADDAVNRAAAAGVAASTAIAQAAADIAALAMSLLMGKDPGVGFPLGLIITGSPNVRIGGFPMPGWMTILRGLLKMLQPVLRRVQMKLPSGKLRKALCFLTGDPVEVASGRMITSAVDFEFPGRIPIVFERSYDTSSIDYEGPLGWGWTHTYDQHLWYDRQQRAMIWRDEEGRVVGFDPLDIGERVYHPLERVWLERTGEREYVLKGQVSQLRYTFGSAGAASENTEANGLKQGHSEVVPLRLLEIRDRNDNRLTMEYTGGRLSSIVDGAGLRVLLSYEQRSDGRIRLKEVRRAFDRDRSSMLVNYAYNADGELSDVTDRTHVPFRYYYDRHLMVRRTNRNGVSFYFEYQGEGREARCVHTWGDGGIYERWITYQPRSRVTVVLDGLGGETIYYFNEIDQITRVRDAKGGIRKFEYGHGGELLQEEDELGRKTNFAYDQLYNCIAITHRDGTTRRVEYNEASQPVLIEDEMHGIWRHEYDDRGNTMVSIGATGARREFRYDRDGSVTEMRDALGNRIGITWHETGEVRSIERPSGIRSVYVYDDQRRLIEVLDEGSKIRVTYAHDRAGRLVRVTERDRAGQTMSTQRYDYDPEGNLTQYVDGRGNVTRHRYGGFNEVIERIDGSGCRRRLEYDREGQIVAVENEQGETYRIEYDLLQQVVKEIDFDGGEHEFEFDASGDLTRHRDAAGRTTQYVRDQAGRVKKRIRADLTTVEYEYDACARLVMARTRASEVRFTYDAAWRLVREEQNGKVIEYEYNQEGQRAARRVMGEGEDASSLVEYEYDADGMVLGVHAAGQSVKYGRDTAGRVVVRELPNGLLESYRYDAGGRIIGQQLVSQASGREIVRRAYSWDAVGNILQREDSLRGSRRYTYDSVERLDLVERRGTGAKGMSNQTGSRGEGPYGQRDIPRERRLWEASDDEGAGQQSPGDREVERFKYDCAGNLVERTTNRGRKRSFSYGQGNQLQQQDETQYTYDLAGNLIEKRGSQGSVIRYRYDPDDQLVAIESPGSGLIEFEYDPFGRRIAKRTTDETVGFLWDGDVMFSEFHTNRPSDACGPVVEYIYQPGTFLPEMRIRTAKEGKSLEIYHNDYIGSPRELTDPSGELVWSAEYDEYGKAEAVENRVPQQIRFQGQYEDSDTALHYNRFRYYDSDSGRYITKDPIGLFGGFNFYAYVDTPTGETDTLGLMPWAWNPDTGMGHHLVPRNKANSAGLPLLGTDRHTPTYFPEPYKPGMHEAIHQAQRPHVGALQGPWEGTPRQLLNASRKGLVGLKMRGTLKIPATGEIIARNVTPSQAFDHLMAWHQKQKRRARATRC